MKLVISSRLIATVVLGASQLVTRPTRQHELTVTITSTFQLQLQFKELDSLCDY